MLDLKRFEQLKKSKTNNILIIDGTNQLVRSISAAQKRGLQPYSLFFKTIGVLIDKFKPFECYLVLDGEGGNKTKRLLFSQYKANRNTVSKIQTADYETLYQLLKHTPIITLRVNNIQGDDIIGHIAIKNQALNNKVTIVSSDRDFYQLCSKNISVYEPIKRITITQRDVIAKYDCHPINFPLYKALLGDTSDNIPGIKGLGQKTIKKFFPDIFRNIQPLQGDVQNFHKHVSQMQHSDMKLRIMENFNMYKNFFKIVNLRDGCFLTPQMGIIIEQIIKDKKQALIFDKTEFLTQCKKYNIKNQDVAIIFTSLFLLQRKPKPAQ